ncbi:MAG: PEP-CTERM sorting domain-containing protein [Pirellulales bacterium]
MLALEITTPVEAATILNRQNPGNFTRDGTQSFTRGTVLRLTDTSSSDFIAFFATDADAGAGIDVDVFATFQVIQSVPSSADAGARLVINDGINRSAIAACVVINGERGIGLLSSGDPIAPASYPVFVPVDWQALTSIQLRRTASGDAEIMEVNGVAPNPRALLTADMAPTKTRTGPTVEFGAASFGPEITIDYSAFRSEVVVPEPSAFALAALGMLGLMACARRRARCLVGFSANQGLATPASLR